MGHSHERVVFKCGHVAHQCRCMESKPETTLPYPCHSCAGINTAAPSTVDRDALLVEVLALLPTPGAIACLCHVSDGPCWGCRLRAFEASPSLAAWRREMGK
jgi:hypothetical protein